MTGMRNLQNTLRTVEVNELTYPRYVIKKTNKQNKTKKKTKNPNQNNTLISK